MSDNNVDVRQRQHDRLLRRLARYNPSLQYAVALKYAAEEVLADNEIGSEGTSQEVADSILSLLPAPQTVFNSEYFAQPVFAVKLIKDVAALYGCLEVDPRVLNEIDLEKKADPVLMANVWLAHAYDPTMERVSMIIDMYETSRIFNPLTLSMPIDSPTKTRTTVGDRKSHLETENGNEALDVEPSGKLNVPLAANVHRNITDAPSVHEQGKRNGSPVVPKLGVPSSDDPQRRPGDATKKALAVEQYFRSTKYTGDLSQSLQNTLRDYNVCAMQLELTPRQKSLFFINVFGGTARDYFFEHCRDEMTYDELVKVMRTGFDNNARQLAIESELETLTLEKVMRDNEIVDANVGLTKLADKINSLFPQMPIQSQYPKNKVRFLRKAVLEQDWAKASIAQIVTSNFGFDDLLTSLREQYQLEKEVEDAKTKSGSIPSTLYQQYGRNPK